MDFKFDLNRELDISLYLQLFKKLKANIINGNLEPETKLPPIRGLAKEQGINPATVVKAYDKLEKENLIYKKVGSGSFVTPIENKSFEVALKEDNMFDMLDHGQLKLDNDLNFASATPSASLFPVEDFKYTINHVLDRDKGEAFAYQKSQGYYPLRQSISDYLQEKGIEIDIERIQIVSGAQQAIDLLAKILIDYGDTVLVEDPTYSGAISAFESRKARILGIPLYSDGMDMEVLEQTLKQNRISFVYIMSNFQNPTGISWSDEKKERLLYLADKYNFIIIEDDCLSDLYFEGDEPVSLKAFDKEDNVIYIKSFSKIFMPGLRLAFLILPENLLPSILAAKYAADISSAGLTQRAFDLYLREGLWDIHLQKMQSLFSNRFQIMLNSIEQELPEEIKLVYRPTGGLYFWLSLPTQTTSGELYTKALNKGVAFLPGEVFKVNENRSNFFRLSFAAVNEQEIVDGMQVLGRLCKQLLNRNTETKGSNQGFTPLL